MIRKRFEELKHMGQLPSPTGVGMAVLELLQRDDYAIDDLVKILQGDPSMTGKLLRAANSPLMGAATRVTHVRDAAVRLGTATVANMALGFSLLGMERGSRCAAFDYQRFWSLSLAHAVCSQAVAKRLGNPAPAQAFTCGLLCRLGQLALASSYPEEYARLLLQAGSVESRECRRLEAEAFQIDQHQVTFEMLQDWGLPEAFCQAASTWASQRQADDSEASEVRELVQSLRFAAEIAEYFLAQGEDRARRAELISDFALTPPLGAEERGLLLEQAQREWEQWAQMLGLQIQAQLPQEPPSPEAVAALESARAAALAALPDSKPGSKPESMSGSKPESEGGPARCERIRIVAADDDPVSLRLLVHHLRRGGYEVETATNGQEALRVALELRPHIMVVDWMMPVMDGLELCRRLKMIEAGRKIYLLLVTGRDGEDRVVEAFDAGVDDYVTKPFNPRVLLARVRAGQRSVLQRLELESKAREVERQKNALSIVSRKLETAANTDVLTGLANRRFGMDRLVEEWKRCSQQGLPLSLVMIDIDHFKHVNDQFGHDAGDDVLREVASILNRAVRMEDTCARIGGEEFLVVCRGTDAVGAARFAERLRIAVANQIIRTPSFTGQVTVSLGVAERSAGMTRPDELVKRADLALYDAKTAGRNRVIVRRGDGETEARSA